MADRGSGGQGARPRTAALPAVRCPDCSARLLVGPEGARCPGCSRAFPSEAGVLVFSPRDDRYEDQMTETVRGPAFERVPWPLRPFARLDFLVSHKQVRPRFLYDAVRGLAGGVPKAVLDVGSGGGKEVLARLGPVTGVDLSLRALRNARSVYGACVRHDVRGGIPFEDGSFDVVNCSDVLGHFGETERDVLLREIRRVLRPGGHFLAFIETWSALYERNLRRFPEWYPGLLEEMVSRSGHIGLEPARDVRRRLGRHGFRVDRFDLLVSSWSYAQSHASWAARAYPPAAPRDRVLRKLAPLALRTRYTEWLLDDVLGVLSIPARSRAKPEEAIAVLAHAVAV